MRHHYHHQKYLFKEIWHRYRHKTYIAQKMRGTEKEPYLDKTTTLIYLVSNVFEPIGYADLRVGNIGTFPERQILREKKRKSLNF